MAGHDLDFKLDVKSPGKSPLGFQKTGYHSISGLLCKQIDHMAPNDHYNGVPHLQKL
jgi:hypothetical protein